MKKSIAVIISGRGSNLESLLAAQDSYRVRAVYSDKVTAGGLQLAADQQVATHAFPRTDYSSVKEQKAALFSAVIAATYDCVVLAGYMQIVPPGVISALRGRIINLHPSLLPNYPGLHTHERVLAAGEVCHGASVHFVDEGVDTGPLILQKALKIEQEESAEHLQSRVRKIEHEILPFAVSSFCSERYFLSKNSRKVLFDPAFLRAAEAINAQVKI